MTRTKARLLPCLPAIAIAIAAPAFAQNETTDNASVFQDDIVVTAQKRSENAQDVAISITAYSGDQLRALGIERSDEIATFTPGVHTGGSLAGQNTQFTIRGVTQNDFNDIVEAPNAVYLDEGYIGIAQGQSFAVYDIDRVEVLKGPQGTLFGRNATGGLVHYISRLPSLSQFEGYVDARFGVMDSPSSPNVFTVEGAVGGPLIQDKLGVRAAVRWNRQQPYLINLYPQGAVSGPPGTGAASGPWCE